MSYHINGKGEAGVCSATKGKCPFGGEGEHFSTAQEARSAFEESMAPNTFQEASSSRLRESVEREWERSIGAHLPKMPQEVRESLKEDHVESILAEPEIASEYGITLKPEKTDEELAAAYWEKNIAATLGGLPQEGQDFLRRQYIKDVQANPEALAQLRELSQPQELPASTFVTVRNQEGGVLQEGEVSELSSSIFPGVYAGEYYDEATGTDQALTLHVRPDGSTVAHPALDGFTVPASPESEAGVELERRLSETAMALQDAAEDGEYDRLTLLESSSELREALASHEWGNPASASAGREKISALSEKFNEAAHSADLRGEEQVAASYWRASEAVADQLIDLRRESMEAIEEQLK